MKYLEFLLFGGGHLENNQISANFLESCIIALRLGHVVLIMWSGFIKKQKEKMLQTEPLLKISEMLFSVRPNKVPS